MQYYDILIFVSMENFNEKIKRLRKARGLNQNDVCSEIGITQPSLASIESGRTKSISIDLGKKLAKTLSVSFNELFDIDEVESNLHEETDRLKKRIIEIESQLEDKKRLEKYLSKDLLSIKPLILNWVEEFHLTEADFIKSENSNIPEVSLKFTTLLSESRDKEAELLAACVKGGYFSVSDIENKFGGKEVFSDLMSRFRKLL